MQKLKLTELQKKNFLSSSQALINAQQQAQTAQGIVNSNANQFDSILEMIGEAHSIDMKSFPPGTPMNLDNHGYLCIGQPPKASERIKETLLKNGQGKKAKMKVA